MSLLSENVIPGNRGKVFGTNAKEPQTLEKIKSTLELIDGVKDVMIHLGVYPRELTVHTSKMVRGYPHRRYDKDICFRNRTCCFWRY